MQQLQETWGEGDTRRKASKGATTYPERSRGIGSEQSASASARTSAPPVYDYVISVRSTRRIGDGPSAQKFQGLDVLRGQRMVRQENATVVHHMSYAAHRQRLLKKVVINEHVGRYH